MKLKQLFHEALLVRNKKLHRRLKDTNSIIFNQREAIKHQNSIKDKDMEPIAELKYVIIREHPLLNNP